MGEMGPLILLSIAVCLVLAVGTAWQRFHPVSDRPAPPPDAFPSPATPFTAADGSACHPNPRVITVGRLTTTAHDWRDAASARHPSRHHELFGDGLPVGNSRTHRPPR